jgi:hypothetical protein
MEKVKNFSIPFLTSTYGENTIYIFVDFRIKRACRANYRGASFGDAETRKVKGKT